MSRLYNRSYDRCSGCRYPSDSRQCQSNCFRPRPPANTGIIDGCFCEFNALLPIRPGDNFSANVLTKNARAITVFIKNTGNDPITVSLQNSPNGLDFTDDPQQLEIHDGETGYLVPYIFSKYTRVVVKSAHTGAAQIWFQMQDHSYLQYRTGNVCPFS